MTLRDALSLCFSLKVLRLCDRLDVIATRLKNYGKGGSK